MIELSVAHIPAVSENKPVGSTEGSLLGDEPLPTSGAQSNGQPTSTMQTNEDLLAEIFGSSTPGPSTVSPAAKSQKSTVDDILGLFGPNPTTSTSTPAQTSSPFFTPTQPSTSVFGLSPSQSQSPPAPAPAPAPPQPPAARLTAYTAYDQNELKVTLTPQTSAAKPGVVMILARFQVSGSTPATGLTFQAAVPKVSF